MVKYFKREWNETRGDEFDSSGTYLRYFEIGEDNYYIIRQIEIYKNGNRLKYHSEKKFDGYGGLGTEPLEVIEFKEFEIEKIEFEEEWNKRKMKNSLKTKERKSNLKNY